MRERGYRPSLVGPLILITIGVLLLLNQMGRLSWDIWWSLSRFWPVIFILLGIEVLIGISQSRVLYLLGVLIALAVLGGVVGYAMLQSTGLPAERPAADTETILQSLQDADRGLVRLQLGAGAVSVGALADSPNFVEGKVEYAERSGRVEQRFAVSNGRADLDLRSRQEIPIWIPSSRMDETWQLRFTPRIPLEIRIDTGAGSVRADLSGLKMSGLDVNMGVGSATLTLPAVEGTATASIDLAIGEVTVVIPSEVGVKMHISKLFSTLHIDERRFTSSGDDWVSNNYATSPSKLDLRIGTVLGSVNVR